MQSQTLHVANTWQHELANMIRSTKELCDYLTLNPKDLDILALDNHPFPVRVTRSFAERMQKGNPHDPLLQQVLPRAAEAINSLGYEKDPLAEKNANKHPGLLHKYHGRVLLITNESCAIHCRYCFRKTFDYQQNRQNKSNWQRVFEYIANDPAIEEVILSGGDPLMLKDESLTYFISNIAKICQVKILRLHTRMPIVLPSRVSNTLLKILTKSRLTPVVVVHCNHPQEINEEVMLALSKLQKAGVTLLNQAVLLKGINDNAEVQIALSKRLFGAKVLPYYLHMNDKVVGNAHFDVSEQMAKKIMNKVRAALPGYLVPTLIKEQAGKDSKTPIM